MGSAILTLLPRAGLFGFGRCESVEQSSGRAIEERYNSGRLHMLEKHYKWEGMHTQRKSEYPNDGF